MEAVINMLGGMEGVDNLLNGKLKVVLKDGSDAAIRKLDKLFPKGTIAVKANKNVPTKDFFTSKCGVKVSMWNLFEEVVYKKLPITLSCEEHQMDVFQLTVDMWDSEIQNELGIRDYRSVEEVVASMISRIMMWKNKVDGHELLTNGYANIEHARAADGRIVAVSCSFDGLEWSFYCSGLDESGGWGGGRRFSSPALGA